MVIKRENSLVKSAGVNQTSLDAIRGTSKTLGEAAYRALRRHIVSGKLSAGQKLQFRKLVQQYGFGIAPLREALSKLASERLVLFQGQRGYAVAPLSRLDLHEICNLWSELSASSLRLSIEMGDVEWEARVMTSAHKLSSAPLPTSSEDEEGVERWELLHAEFHMSLVAGCNSPWREHFCAVLCDQFERYRRLLLLKMSISPSTADEMDREHRLIAEAAIRRDSNQAVKLLVMHFKHSLNQVDAIYQGSLRADY